MKMKLAINNQPFATRIPRRVGRLHSMLDVGYWMFDVPRSSTAPRRFERGVALVTTLIMLSVTLVMVVAFLALAKRERGSVTTAAETTTARLAADSALAAAQSQIAANILNTPAAAYNFGLLVSTNYINAAGFNSAVVGVNPTNVSYYYPNGNPVTNSTDFPQLIANLYLLPRAPVMTTIDTNDPAGRFYLDVNRNMKFEGNGPQPQIDSAGFFIHTDGTADSSNPVNVATNLMVGDPEWIGVLARPDQPHSANNPFIARYAFFAQPIGNSLDLNYIYNQALSKMVNPLANGNDGFMRNQGVGSWEINLAAFLADLNTNEWDNPLKQPYQYSGTYNTGYAFEDALSLLSWRYNNIYGSLASADNLFPNANNIFPYDNIDAYSDGPLQTTTTNINETLNSTSDGDRNPNDSWAGADNTNHFFALQSDIFDTNKNLGNFPSHLYAAGTNVSTYDRYTFYRMLAQLGTDSSPDDGKLNLNYSNAVVQYNVYGVVTNIAVVPGAETNLMPWTAAKFFNAAANQMLRMYTTNWFQSSPSNYLWTYYGITNNYFYTDSSGNQITNDPSGRGLTNTFPAPNVFRLTSDGIPAFGITNIPVWVSNRFVYSPAVNRLLQLAANLYDSSTTNFYPSVFRPVFTNDGVNVFVCGYHQIVSVPNPPNYGESSDTQLPLSLPMDVQALLDKASGIYSNNIYGVPWVIGAKKYLPGLNQFSMVNSAQLVRKLQVERNTNSGVVWGTNQMIVMSISNNMGFSFWNSYTNDYPTNYGNALQVSIFVSSAVQMVMTNSAWSTPSNYTFVTWYTNWPVCWPGSKWSGSSAPNAQTPMANSFIATNWVNLFLPESVYRFSSATFNFATNAQDYWETNRIILDPLPQFGLLATNRMQAFIVDNTNVIDYVELRDPIDAVNLTGALRDPNDPGTDNYMWATNAWNGKWPSWGIMNQMAISSQTITPPASGPWNLDAWKMSGVNSIADARIVFAAALAGQTNYTTSSGTYSLYEPAVQAGYTATRTIFVPYLYQVNDPLVHYLASDLNTGAAGTWGGGEVLANGAWEQNNGVVQQASPTIPNSTSPGIIKGQSRYQPWGQVSQIQTINYNFGTLITNLAHADPLLYGPDYWDLPTNFYPSVGWIGRVHRGTPWQTVYLKASDVLNNNNNIGIRTWSAWTGDDNTFDAIHSAPVQDRLLFDLFTTRFNDNAVRGTLSVNQTNLASWSALFSGMVALSNSAASLKTIPAYTNLIINPAGVDIAHSAVGKIVSNIYSMRINMSLFPQQTFTHVGDILSVPALTVQSPFLNQLPIGTLTTANIQQSGISDEVYEWLPQQVMGLVRCSTTPRYVLYCYGQTLKPAPNGLVTSGTYFGLCTNYQVTAESAVRAVIRVDKQITPTGTNYSTVVESYNVLPSN